MHKLVVTPSDNLGYARLLRDVVPLICVEMYRVVHVHVCASVQIKNQAC